MADPTGNWEEWSQPAIEPFMEAVVHFPSGDVTLTDNDISLVNLNGNLFEQSAILFGPPEPATASIELVDFKQTYNPTRNLELKAGIQVDLYMCCWPTLNPIWSDNIATTSFEPIEVMYLDNLVWATVVITSEAMIPGMRYMLEYTYEDYVTGIEQTEQHIFIVPDTWFERTIYAITKENYHRRIEANIYKLEPIKEKYGQFYTQEWQYDTFTHTATIDLVDSMSDALLLDNRPDSTLPSTDVALSSFFVELLSLYDTPYYFDTIASLIPYSLYYSTQAGSINKMLEALGASYCFMPDGSSVVCTHRGAYDTGITLTDDDVETYEVLRTSANTYDSIYIEALIPHLEETQLFRFENFETDGSILPIEVDGIYDVSYISTAQNSFTGYKTYNWTVQGISWPYSEQYSLIGAYGNTVQSSVMPVYTLIGSLPYEIKDNKYIQTLAQAKALLHDLEAFAQLPYNIVTLTLRGCPLLWMSGRVTLDSEIYNLIDDYVIIGLQFNYDGAIHTTLTLQRTIE